jgi:hypothetical protein
VSGLLIRYDGEIGALRSVGDAPNGVVTVVVPDDGPASYAVDCSYDYTPVVRSRELITVKREHHPGGVPPSATPVDVGDLLDACESGTERGMVVRGVVSTILSAAEHNAQADLLMVEYLQSHVDFLAALREALVERGFVRRVEGPES